MKTVKEIIEELSKYNPESFVYTYEGESTGIVIMDTQYIDAKEIGWIDAPYEYIKK